MFEVSFAHTPVSLVKTKVCLQEQRKQVSLLTLAKENQFTLGLYRNPPTNPHFVLLISDRCFVLIHVRHFFYGRALFISRLLD